MPGSPLISVERLSKSYRIGDVTVPVLRDLSLSIAAGEFVAMMGSSGSGKSTLLNVLGLLDGYETGSYVLDGEDTRGLSDARAAALRNRAIGFVFQSFHLLPQKSAWENVALPLRYAGHSRKEQTRRAHELLERVGLGDRAQHRPNQLSGGQRQRVAIARAVAVGAPLLLADEPTGNLDSETSHGVLELFAELHRQGRTIVLVTHEPHVASIAQRTIHVRDGRLVRSPPFPQEAP